ncbi:MAG: cytochrome c nitrite reductase small subunit [Bacteroidaceae bacterium]|nr:cytochrome c nitrite reductase small subunit [Bacteroidaceae bacterium]
MKIPYFTPLKRWQKVVGITLAGVLFGCGFLFMYLLRAHTYLGNESEACMNCHVMTPFYATWFHSSHSRNATCNDCHVPHENAVKYWTFKGTDGMKHVSKMLTHGERMAPEADDATAQVVMNNCIRCHTELNTELVKTGKIDFMMVRVGNGKACWDCHRNVPHGKKNSLAATPAAKVPHPSSPVPDWLQNLMK